MRRYLIHHDRGGTWDLVVAGGEWSVEWVGGANRRSMTVKEFEASEEGRRLIEKLNDAVQRAMTGLT